jgi:Immunoglobulin I-set domain
MVSQREFRHRFNFIDSGAGGLGAGFPQPAQNVLTLDSLSLTCLSFNCVRSRLFCTPVHPTHRQEKKLSHNISVGVITTNQSLVLQRVSRHSAGRYRCSATNREGETESDVFHLNVKCKPL